MENVRLFSLPFRLFKHITNPVKSNAKFNKKDRDIAFALCCVSQNPNGLSKHRKTLISIMRNMINIDRKSAKNVLAGTALGNINKADAKKLLASVENAEIASGFVMSDEMKRFVEGLYQVRNSDFDIVHNCIR